MVAVPDYRNTAKTNEKVCELMEMLFDYCSRPLIQFNQLEHYSMASIYQFMQRVNSHSLGHRITRICITGLARGLYKCLQVELK